jgi:undecaprenyl-diphosphatase
MNTRVLFRALFFLQIFVLLAIAISYYPQGVWVDQEVLYALHGTSNPLLDKFASFFTNLGIYGATTPILLLLSLVLAYQQKWRYLLYVAITALGSVALTYETKSFFPRIRPHLWPSTYPWLNSFSFPSGHALSSMILVMILATVIWHSKWRTLVIILGSVFVILIAWTRMYLGVHYPSDILGGWSLAIAWSLLVQRFVLGFTKNWGTILKNE